MNKLPEASSTKAGIITTGTQTVAGDKTISGNLNVTSRIEVSQGQVLEDNAKLEVIGGGNGIYWGHTNPDYTCSIGAYSGSGASTITFFGYHGSSSNTYNRSGSTLAPVQIVSSSGDLFFYNSSAGAADSAITWTQVGKFDASGAWTFGPSSGSALTHKFQSGGQTVVQSESTTGHAFLRISSAASSDAQLDFLESTTTRWSMFNRGSTDNFELTCSAGGVLLVTQAGNWTIGPTNYTGTHILNGNLNLKKNGSGNALVVTEQSTGEVELVLQRTAGTTASWEMYIPSGATTLNWWVGANRMILDTSGNLSITGSLSQSDSRLKNVQGTLTSALNELDTITPVYYTWIEGYGYDERTHIGLLAQEVEQVFPELVFDQDDIKRLNYGNFCAVLVTAIKELKARVEALENA